MLTFSKNVKLLLIAVLLWASILTINPLGTAIPNVTFNSSNPVVKVDAKQLACMAKNIFYEAGSESIKGQAAVAMVVMNRVNYGFATNPCNVVYQKITVQDRIICQFSWVCEGKKEPNKNSYRYKVAEQIAYEVMYLGMHKDVVPKSTLFFHSINIDPMWPYKKVATIGGHVFYSKAKKPKESVNDR
jgi:spore germination cell wall hydrolase CwlJ-like protein